MTVSLVVLLCNAQYHVRAFLLFFDRETGILFFFLQKTCHIKTPLGRAVTEITMTDCSMK